MPKIKNPSYKNFIDKGVIALLNRQDIEKALKNIKGKNRLEGRALLIALYYTGARPVEILELKGKHIEKERSYFKIQIPLGAKHGLPRPIYISQRFRIAKELYDYARSIFPDQFMFWHYRTEIEHRYVKKNGEERIYLETTKLVYYYVKKWFKGVIKESITPYFLRHSKLSQLSSDGASVAELQQFKGARDPRSVQPYLHMSKKSAAKLARINK